MKNKAYMSANCCLKDFSSNNQFAVNHIVAPPPLISKLSYCQYFGISEHTLYGLFAEEAVESCLFSAKPNIAHMIFIQKC